MLCQKQVCVSQQQARLASVPLSAPVRAVACRAAPREVPETLAARRSLLLGSGALLGLAASKPALALLPVSGVR
jgi:hypothetical protein